MAEKQEVKDASFNDITEMFAAISKSQVDKVMTQPQVTVNPLFKPEDIPTAGNVLMKFFRYLCVVGGISLESIKKTHRRWCHAIGYADSGISTHLNNTLKPVKHNEAGATLTWTNLTGSLLPSVGKELIDVSFTLKDTQSGEITTITLKEIEEYCAKNVKHTGAASSIPPVRSTTKGM
jgi:hypothetical protein